MENKRTFNEIFEYYNNLYNYHELSPWFNYKIMGMDMWHDYVTEGLITSYPKRKVVELLEKNGFVIDEELNFWEKDKKYDDYTSLLKDKSSIFCRYKSEKKDTQKERDEINGLLIVYGYSISQIRISENGWVFCVISPIHPVKINSFTNDFYHVTTKKAIKKIQDVGLVPKESKTVFEHPSGRIYLFYTKNPESLEQFRLYFEINHNKPDTVLLKVDIDIPKIEIFVDPIFNTVDRDYMACFTLTNIPPDKITITDL